MSTFVLTVVFALFFAQSSLAQDISFDGKAQIDWETRISGRKIDVDADGIRSARLHNEREYRFVTNLLVEGFGEQSPILQNIYDFDNEIVIHKLNGSAGSKKCKTAVTPFKDLPAEQIAEMRSLSCYMVGNWYSLVSRGKTENPFYHKQCSVLYDERR